MTGIPFSFTAHAVDIFHESVRDDDLQLKLQQAHHAVTISRFNLRYLRRRFPAATSRLHLVRNGLELERFPYRDPRPLETPLRLAAVGRLVEKKGFQHLLPAAAELLDQGVKLELRIAGTGIMAEELEASINQLRLQDNVHLLGPQTQDQIHELLDSADVFLAPCVVGADGNADGMPTVLLEAMATGVPCVSTSVTGIPEAIRNGSTGVLVRPGNSHALARAVHAIASPGTDRAALARSARALVEEDYDVRRQAGLLRALSRPERQVA
jgi:glycosyltransferase involved in cell wall biosynthesis